MITIIDVNKFIKENTLEGPVSTSQLFMDSRSFDFHPNGLLSEDIFGLEGSKERGKSFSWIELNCRVIHPVFYDMLVKRIEKRIPEIISGDKSFSVTDEGELYEDENGEIRSLETYAENIGRIKFRNTTESEDRGKLIKVLEENIKKGTYFIDKLIVTSPNFREISIDEEKGEVVVHELTKLYQKVLILSGQLKSVSGELFDSLNYRMQLTIRSLFDLIRNLLSKKSGMIRNLLLGRRVDFSARSVIYPEPTLNPTEIGIPLRMAVQIFEPFMIYGLVNSNYSGNIPEEFHKEARRFLGKESTGIV